MEKNESKKNFKDWLKDNTILTLVCALIVGLLLGACIMYFTNNSIAIHVNGKNISSKELYNEMKDYFSIELVLEDVDSAILNKKYQLTEDEIKALKETADSYISMYQSYYGYSEEDFFEMNGFKDRKNFEEYMKLNYKRNICYYEYLEKLLEENAVQKYYEDNSFGELKTKHILIKTLNGDITDEDALKTANEIIERLNNGENFDSLAKEYSEAHPDYIVTEELGFKSNFSRLEEGYIAGMRELNAGEYSKEPAKSSYGYHIIYCIERRDKAENLSREEKMAIIDILAAEIISDDPDIYDKALIKLREDAGLKFYEKDLKEKYEEYCLEFKEAEK